MVALSLSKQILKCYDWQLISILAIAAFLRFFLLDLRPAHHDEGINGWFVDQITVNGFYRYDPNNYHGPLHFYILFIFQTLLGRSEFVLRLPTVLISLLSVYWMTLFSRFFDRKVSLLAAFTMAISPAFVFFGKFAIHESDLVYFAILVFWGIVGLWREGTKKYLWAISLGISGMILTKETFIVHLSCFILAWICLIFWEKIYPSEQEKLAKQSWTDKDIIFVIIVNLGLVFFFYSGTFLNIKGFLGLFQTLNVWVKTGSEQAGHAKPFIYWAKLFFLYEQPALIGLLACIWYLKPSSKWIRYIAIYGLGTLLAYSLIPYKTPWCIISILWPFYFVFGDVVIRLLKLINRSLVFIACAIIFLISIFLAVRLNFFHYEDNKEPYIYVHTFNDIKKLTTPIFQLVGKDASNYNLVGNVLRSDEWPLPWIFGDFTMIGYFNPQLQPQNYDADFLVVESRRIDEVEEKLKNKYFTDTMRMRDSQDPSRIYFSSERFKDIFPNQNPTFIPKPSKPLLPGQGLLSLVYPNATWSGTPAIKKVVDKIDFYWEGNSPLPPPFSIEFVGDINLHPDSTFVLSTDDGGFLEIGGTRVINDPGPHGIEARSAIVQNKSGWQKIKVGFYDIGGGALIRLTRKGIEGIEHSIPVDDLHYDERLLK